MPHNDERVLAGFCGSRSDRRDADLVVLVVDADGETRELYRQWLAATGARVHEAIDGRDALVQVFKVRPNVVVLDARLPFIDGHQLCSLLRGDAATMSLCLVAITSDGTPDHIRRFQERGADVVFVKPVPGEALAAAAWSGAAMRHATHQADDRAMPRVPVVPRTVAKARAYERYVSTTPPLPPPHLRCPQCDGALQYDRSHVGGVSERHVEQWDYFICTAHGVFQYRHRTRKLRPAS